RYVCGRGTELNLPPQQAGMAERRRAAAENTVELRTASAHICALVPDQPDPGRPTAWREVKAEGGQGKLAERVTARLRSEGLLTTVYAPRSIWMDLTGPLRAVWSKGHVSTGDLWSYYCRHPYLTRLRD